MRHVRLTPAMGVALLALFLAIGTPVVWGHGGNDNLIHSCVANTSGSLRVVSDPTTFGDPDTRCRVNEEHALDWGLVGPAGPRGPAGQQGPAGQPGPQGPPGAAEQGSRADVELKWYRTGLPGTVVRSSDPNSKVVGTLVVPDSSVYLAQASVSITTSVPRPFVWCSLEGNSQPGYGDSQTAQFYGRWKVPGALTGNLASKVANLHYHTLNLEGILVLPRGRDSKVFVRCRLVNQKPGVPPPPPYAHIGDGRIHAIRLGGVK